MTTKIPGAMRAKGYSDTKAIDRALQMQVRQEVEKLKGEVSAAAPAGLSAAAAMVTLSLIVMPRVLVLILPEDANSTLPLHLPSPPRKTHRTSHQCQVDCQNKQESKDVYAQALAQATMLVATKRTQAKENCCPKSSVVAQVEPEFKLHGFVVSLSSKTVNRFVRNDIAGSAPLLRGYEGIMSRAVFKLLVLAVESFIEIKQLNCEVIVGKQLMVMVNELCGIASKNLINENMFKWVLRSTTVFLVVMVAPALEERQVLWTTYDNLHMWFMSFKEILLQYGFVMLSSDGGLVFTPEMLCRILNIDETELSLKGRWTSSHLVA